MEEVTEQCQGVDRLVLQQVQEGSHGLSDLVGNCHIFSGAPTTHGSRDRCEEMR